MNFSAEKRLVILAEGSFGPTSSKTATGIIRYGPNPVVAVLDSTKAGQSASHVLGIPKEIPIVASLHEVWEKLHVEADVLVIGIAPRGGGLPQEWKAIIFEAIEHGLDIWNGLHYLLSEDDEMQTRAERTGSNIWDVRKPPDDLPVASGFARNVSAHVVLSVGSDCCVGKMTAMLELERAASEAGHKAAFCPTGQTGIMIKGWGIPIDRVIADFVAGGAERLVLEASRESDIILVEGQGSVFHAGYSGVSLGLLHGSMPDHQLLCYQVGREFVGDGYGVRVPPLAEMIRYLELFARPVKPAPVIGLVANTLGLTDDEAKAELKRAEDETGLPADDIVRYGAGKMLEVLVQAGNALEKTD